MKSYKYKLYGAILGDLAGQPFEFKYKGDYSDVKIHNPNSKITDDTLMTLASASAILNNIPIHIAYKNMGRKYYGDYYGKNFKEWIQKPYSYIANSYGNGCLMRLSPFMYTKDSLPLVMESIMYSHKHQISAESILRLYNAYQGKLAFSSRHLQNEKKFQVEADCTIDRVLYHYDRNRVSTQDRIIDIIKDGGDTDTNASILGELSNFWNRDITEDDAKYVESKLDNYQLIILKKFNE